MRSFFQWFIKNDEGAVTVDWVVLTAAVVGLGWAAVSGIQSSNGTVTDQTSEYLERQEPQFNPDIQNVFSPS